MKLYSENENYKLYHGSMLDMGEVIAPNSIDAIVTDPPYELNFMNKGWDNSGIAFQKETWEKCFEVLKPGGFLLAFGGSRTFHRIAVAIEDAGFEIRDVIMWLYGSGFPKSMDLGKSVESKVLSGSANKTEFKKLAGEKTEAGNWGISGNTAEYGARPRDYSADGHLRTTKVDYQTEEGLRWDGWGTCLKPSYEPVLVARKPCEGSITDNVLKWGVGGMNIAGCRLPFEDTPNPATNPLYRQEHGYKHDKSNAEETAKNSVTNFSTSQNPVSSLGRFPSNTILTYDESDRDEVCGGMPEGGRNGSISHPYDMNNLVYGDYGQCKEFEAYDDSGSAARYFYCAKATLRDREEGLEELEAQSDFAKGNGLGRVCEFCGAPQLKPELCKCKVKSWIMPKRKNIHPTVKPTMLMQYLVRLVTPTGGTVLDPFNGSGSTGKGVMYENLDYGSGYKYIGIELTESYLPIAKARIENADKTLATEKEEPVDFTAGLVSDDTVDEDW